MLNVAMEIDPAREIEKRINELRRIEESGGGAEESGRSISMSQSYAPSESIGAKKKKVKFEATPSPSPGPSAKKY